MRSDKSIIKGMRREHDRLIRMGREVERQLEALVAEMLRRSDCSDYEHELHVPGRACSCGIDEAIDRILKGE